MKDVLEILVSGVVFVLILWAADGFPAFWRK
jgi:hypothetical protein